MSDGINSIDDAVLARYLKNNLPGFEGQISTEKFKGGQSNPTFKVTTSSGTLVLRKQPPGILLKSAHAVDREYRVMNALLSSDVPVPKMIHLCEDTSILGSKFFLMEFKQGRTFWDSALPGVSKEERSKVYDQVNAVLANLHDTDINNIGLETFGRPGNYFSRQLTRWTEQYRASQFETLDEMEWIIKWLHERIPQDDNQVSLVHGDFRLDNLMYDLHQAKLIAVLDWELSTLGHPFADLANHCMQQRMPENIGDMSGLAGRNLNELGIPDERQFVERYCERRSIEKIDHWDFYLSFSIFRLAAILQGVAKRGRDGNASSTRALEVHKAVAPLAVMAKEIAKQGVPM